MTRQKRRDAAVSFEFHPPSTHGRELVELRILAAALAGCHEGAITVYPKKARSIRPAEDADA
jgi:hypothetical protein